MPSFNKGSYTEYSNKIGLYSNSQGSFISQSPDVVLNFPYKDCVLEGGMTKEDAKRDERFLNVKLDKRDIDTLFDPKVLTNFKYIDSNSERELSANDNIGFFDEDGELKQNLLIKGNNLVALHTLREKLAGKIKLIYIDPPYYFHNSQQGDSFKYNSSFKLSTWLVFMKNRLQVARDLLCDDGVVLVSINDEGYPYLRVLMDELFGQANFIADFMWMRTSTPPSLSKTIRKKMEYIPCYANGSIPTLVGGYVDGGDMPLLNAGNPVRTLRFAPGTVEFTIPNGTYMSGNKGRTILENVVSVENGTNTNTLVLTGEFKWTQETVDKEINNGTKFIVKSDIFAIRYCRQGERIKKPSNLITKEECNVGTNEEATKELFALFHDNCFTYSKPESLLRYLIEMTTKPNDIVLDFCLGSGTTAAVAHKMGRRWIGIEQMDYIETIAKERLKKVIAGEQGGISKSVNWQGGGSFVYMELKKYNQEYVDQINAATNMTELEEVYKKMYQNAFLKFWFDKKTFERDERFRSMDLNTRKQALISILDENQLYLNYADMDDAKYHVSDDERALTKCFYGDDSDDSNDTEAGK